MPPLSNLPIFGSPPPSANTLIHGTLLAQVTPQPSGAPSPTVSQGSPTTVGGAPTNTPSSLPSTGPRLTWPDIVAMGNEWRRLTTNRSGQPQSFEQKVLGSNYSQWAASRNTTYQNVSMTLLRIENFLQGRETDTYSLRSSLLEWFRSSRESNDSVLRNTPISLIDHLNQFGEPHYRERALKILSLIEETRRLNQPSNPGGSYVPASYFADSLRRRGIDPSWFIPSETLASPETLKAAMIYQGEEEDGVIRIPILTQTSRGPATIGWREVDVTGRILDSYAPRPPLQDGQILRRPLLPSQSTRLLIAAAFGLEELPSTGRTLNIQELRVASLIRSGWIAAELTHHDQELTQLRTLLASLQAPAAQNTPELNRITARVEAIQTRVNELNQLIPAPARL